MPHQRPAGSRQQDGDERGERVWLIDYARPENNEFLVVNQFTVVENQQKKRLDLVLYVNGMPLVVIELKNATDEQATLKTAYQQIETYKHTIPALFACNAWVVISDGLEAKAGAISAGLSRFMAWKSADGKAEASHLVSQLETLIVGMLNPATLLDLLGYFIVFEKARKEDPETGQISISTVKKLAAYHQYYAVNAAVASTLRAADLSAPSAVRENPASYGVPGVRSQPKGDMKAGVVWHTQGSGKSLSMVFYTGKIVQAMDNPTVLYAEIVKLRPEWHDTDLKKGAIKVVMTAASSDGPALAQHHTTKEQRKLLAERMKDDADPLKLVIVRDMWLTGFDAPSMHTLYIDKPMKGHNLMQAIARVNRVYKDKPGSLVVDYLGIAADLKLALSFYSDAGGKGDPTLAQEQAVAMMLEKIEVVSSLFHGFAYEHYFDADTAQKLSLILAAEEHVLGLDEGRKRYLDEVTALSQAFAIAVPHEQALDAKDAVGFFQAVKARLVKFDSPVGGRSNEELETTIRQVIDQALVSEQVIDVFDAAGIKKPDISILSDDFLAELKGYEHKNVALEVLKKLLNDELKSRAKRNLVQARSLMDMLEAAIRKYHAKILTAAEVMDELIKVSKDIVASDNEAKSLGLTDFEYAFYSAVANNDSAKQLMQQDQLRELAVVLTQRVRENASIDWTIKENVKAKLKVIVKRTLRQFGYPPDMQLLATETVLKQAEMMAAELAAG